MMDLNILGKLIIKKQNTLNTLVSSKGLADTSVLLLSEEIDNYIVAYYTKLKEITDLNAAS